LPIRRLPGSVCTRSSRSNIGGLRRPRTRHRLAALWYARGIGHSVSAGGPEFTTIAKPTDATRQYGGKLRDLTDQGPALHYTSRICAARPHVSPEVDLGRPMLQEQTGTRTRPAIRRRRGRREREGNKRQLRGVIHGLGGPAPFPGSSRSRQQKVARQRRRRGKRHRKSAVTICRSERPNSTRRAFLHGRHGARDLLAKASFRRPRQPLPDHGGDPYSPPSPDYGINSEPAGQLVAR